MFLLSHRFQPLVVRPNSTFYRKCEALAGKNYIDVNVNIVFVVSWSSVLWFVILGWEFTALWICCFGCHCRSHENNKQKRQ